MEKRTCGNQWLGSVRRGQRPLVVGQSERFLTDRCEPILSAERNENTAPLRDELRERPHVRSETWKETFGSALGSSNPI